MEAEGGQGERRRLTRLAGCLLAAVLLAIGTAQGQSGGLKVRVVSATGPLPGAIVTLSSDRGWITETSRPTDRNGMVEFPILRAGSGYILEASLPSYSSVRLSGIRVPIHRTTLEVIQLSPEMKETVRVVVDREVVDLEKVESSTRFSDDFIQDLPVPGRLYQNVLTLAPGVQDADGDGNPNVHGSRSRDFKAIVSGISNVDPLTGRQLNQVNPNSIEEMEVITAGAGVEFGRAQGGFANIIQKQGTNEFEGLLELLFRSSHLDGSASSSSRGSGAADPSYTTWQPSVQFSGPIRKDKLWFRLSHEWINREDPVNLVSESAVVKTRRQIHSDQLTWQASPRNKLALQFQSDPLLISNLGVSSLRSVDSSVRSRNGGDTWSLTWTVPYSTRLLVDSVASYQDTRFRLTPTRTGVRNDCYPQDPRVGNLSLQEAYCFDATTSRFSGTFNTDNKDHRQRLTVKSTANLYGGRFLGMTHRLKAGFSVENERYFRTLTVGPELTVSYREGGYDPNLSGKGETDPPVGDPTQSGGFGSPATKKIILARVSIPETVRSTATGTNWALFLEDQIQPATGLSMTLGVRTDSEQLNMQGRAPFDPEAEFTAYLRELDRIAAEEHRVAGADERLSLIAGNFLARGDIIDFYTQVGRTVGFPGIGCSGLCSPSFQLKNQQHPDDLAIQNINISPFLSVAWDPFLDGKTKIAMAAGRHYNSTILGIPLSEIRPVSADVAIGCDGLTCQVGTTSIVPNVTSVSRDLKTPYQDEWVLSAEREIFTETVARLTYINRKYENQFQDLDLNHVPEDFYTDELCLEGPDRLALGPDGTEDDCTGNLLPPPFIPPGQEEPPREPDPFGFGFLVQQRPDGLPDLYVQNPFWGEVFLVGNFNRSDYEAYVLELVRRRFRGWEMQGSYTWSRSTGDGEDFAQGIGDDRSLVEDEFGFQSQDQRHVVKLTAATVTPWGFRLGTAVTWQSGLPYSVVIRKSSLDSQPPVLGELGVPAVRTRTSFPGGFRNGARNRSWWNVDLKSTREWSLARRGNLQLSLEVFNLLDERVYQVYNPATESGVQINGRNEATVTNGRRFQVSGRFTF